MGSFRKVRSLLTLTNLPFVENRMMKMNTIFLLYLVCQFIGSTKQTAPGSGDCTCMDYISSSGHGNCKLHKGRPMCFVTEPTTCRDARYHFSTSTKKYSWI